MYHTLIWAICCTVCLLSKILLWLCSVYMCASIYLSIQLAVCEEHCLLYWSVWCLVRSDCFQVIALMYALFIHVTSALHQINHIYIKLLCSIYCLIGGGFLFYISHPNTHVLLANMSSLSEFWNPFFFNSFYWLSINLTN